MRKNETGFSAVRLVVFLALSIAVMLLIFIFSAQNGELSNASSGFVSDLLARILSPVLPDSAISFILKYIRKIAHICIYFLLGIFTSLSAAELSRRIGRSFRCLSGAWFLCVLYAASDEFHQSFPAGRSASPRDVLLDSAGALAAAIVVGAVCRAKRRRGRRRAHAETSRKDIFP